MTDPVRKTVTVPLPPAEAFDLFTAGLDRWWPKDTHSLSAATGEGGRARVRVEPREGGRVIETRPDGSEAPWGTITRWEPGARLALDWHVGRDPAEATHVDVTFTGTEAGTRVDLIHSRWTALGTRAAEISAGYDSGWDHVLGHCFAGACSRIAA